MNNLAVVEAFIEASSRGDREATAALCHQDFKVEESDGLPYGGTYYGAGGFWKLIDVVFSTWSNPKIETIQRIGEPDASTFAFVMTMEGTSKSSGASFSTTVCELWSVKDGKVVAIKPYYWDTKLMSGLVRVD